MRKIALIGGGQAGLLMGFMLLEKGFDVTLYSDRTPDQLLAGRIPSTAFLFDSTLAMERALGLNFWEHEVPFGEGMHVDFRSPDGHIRLTVQGKLGDVQGQALDQRTKYARWQPEFERRGGKLIIQSVSIDDLEAIAAENDLTMVASGKGPINALFKRDDARSTHDKPPRHLAALLLKGPKLLGDRPWGRVPFRPLRFNFVAGVGEFFSLPFYTHTAGECRSFLFEAVPGGPMDRFGAARDGDEVLDIAKGVIRDFAPDDLHHMEEAELTDPNAWLSGAFTPTIRHPVGTLPSGRIVMALGDTAVLNDPITGQGSNNASRMVQHVFNDIVAHGAAPFDAPWMRNTVDTFWQESGQYTTAFTNALLMPPGAPVMEVLTAATTNPAVGDEFMRCFNNPRNYWPWITDLDLAKQFVAERTPSHAA